MPNFKKKPSTAAILDNMQKHEKDLKKQQIDIEDKIANNAKKIAEYEGKEKEREKHAVPLTAAKENLKKEKDSSTALEAKLQEQNIKLEEQKTAVAAKKKEIQALTPTIDQTAKDYDASASLLQKIQPLEKELKELKKEREITKKEIENIKKDKSEADKNIKKYSKDIEHYEGIISKIDEYISKNDISNDNLKITNDALIKEKEKIAGKLEKIREDRKTSFGSAPLAPPQSTIITTSAANNVGSFLSLSVATSPPASLISAIPSANINVANQSDVAKNKDAIAMTAIVTNTARDTNRPRIPENLFNNLVNNNQWIENFCNSEKYVQLFRDPKKIEFLSEDKKINITVDEQSVKSNVPAEKEDQKLAIMSVVKVYLESIKGKAVIAHKIECPDIVKKDVEDELKRQLIEKGITKGNINGTAFDTTLEEKKQAAASEIKISFDETVNQQASPSGPSK